MNLNLVRAIQNSPPPPCSGCRLFKRCKNNHLACRAFIKYLDMKCDSKPYPYAVSIPKRRLYNKIFRACDNCKPLCGECQ